MRNYVRKLAFNISKQYEIITNSSIILIWGFHFTIVSLLTNSENIFILSYNKNRNNAQPPLFNLDSSCNWDTLFRNLKKWCLSHRGRGTLQPRYQLWYRVFCIETTPSRGHPCLPPRDTLGISMGWALGTGTKYPDPFRMIGWLLFSVKSAVLHDENKYTIPLNNTMFSYFVDHSIDIPEPACGSYHDFFDGGLLLTRKLLTHGFLVIKLKSSFRKFYRRHHNLVKKSLKIPGLFRIHKSKDTMAKRKMTKGQTTIYKTYT